MASQDGEGPTDCGMRIGRNYQAEIPDVTQELSVDVNVTRPMASLMWSPNPSCLDSKVDFYIEHATNKFNYSQEQALGLLLWHHHDVDVAISDLSNFAKTPDDWTSEDKIIFEQALCRFGKNFSKIHDLMPDKSVGSLVRYYYSWKKSKKPTIPGKRISTLNQEDSKGSFDVDAPHLQEENKRQMDSWTTFRVRSKSRTPYDLYVDAKDLKLIARGYSDHMLGQLESELAHYKNKVARNKEVLDAMRSDLPISINQFRIPESIPREINPKWTNIELLVAMQGLRYFGKDFQAVSELLCNKSEHQVRNFFFNHKARCNFDADGSKDNKSKMPDECKMIQLDAPSRQGITMTPNKSFQDQKSFLQSPSQIFYNKEIAK